MEIRQKKKSGNDESKMKSDPDHSKKLVNRKDVKKVQAQSLENGEKTCQNKVRPSIFMLSPSLKEEAFVWSTHDRIPADRKTRTWTP